VRPEVVAFRELESLVRNLSEQLAGYRKRALSAEVRCRELELSLANAKAEQIRTATSLHDAERSRAELEKKLSSTPQFPDEGSTSVDPRVAALMRENQELTERLEMARERTVEVTERIRFLRQQMTVEK
jgi:hypothetical protein